MAKISSLNVEIGASTGKLKKGLKDAQASIKSAFNTSPVDSFNGSIDKVTGNLGKLSATMTKVSGMLAAGFGIKTLAGDAISAGDATYRLAQRMHITAAEAGNLKKIMSLTGGDVTSLSSAMMRLDKTYTASSTEGEKCRYIFDQLGLSLQDQQGRLLPINEQLKVLATGYKAANDAGQGQEFIMNTLGVKGMALVSTLEQYNEAAEAAGRVKSIGLDPEQMHELNLQLQTMQLQAGQLNLAFTAAFAPLANELLPVAMETMQSLATVIKEHKELISSVAIDVVKLVAAYEGFKAVNSIFTRISAAWAVMTASEMVDLAKMDADHARTMAMQEKRINARYDRELTKVIATFEKEGALTKEQEARQIAAIEEVEAKRIASIERMQAAMEAAYEKERAQAQITSAEEIAGTEKATAAKKGQTVAIEQNAAAMKVAGETGVAAESAVGAAVNRTTAAIKAQTAAAGALIASLANVAMGAYIAVEAVNAVVSAQAKASYAADGGTYGEVNGNRYVAYEDGEGGYKLFNIENVANETDIEDIISTAGFGLADGSGGTHEQWNDVDVDTDEGKQILASLGLHGKTADIEPPTMPELDFSVPEVDGGTGGGSAGGGADDSAKKLEAAIKRMQSLSESMNRALGKNDASLTEYQQKLADIENTISDYEKKIQDVTDAIAEAGGAEDDELKGQLAELVNQKKALHDELVDNLNAEWQKKNDELVARTELAYAKMNGDYKALLDAELAAKIAQLDAERDAKEQELAKSGEDAQAQLNLLNWYGAQRLALTEEYAAKERAEWAKAYPLMAAQEEAMKTVSMSIGEYLENNWLDISKSISNNFGNTVAEFIKGNKTMADVFHSFADSVVSELARIAAAKVAAGIFSGISGLFSGGGSSVYSSLSSGLTSSFSSMDFSKYVHVATGGYISGEGTSTSDSIPAMLSNGEFVVNAAATKRYRGLLERINGYSSGGYVSTPSMATGSYRSAGAMGGGCVVNITNNSNANVKQEGAQWDSTMQKWILDIVVDGADRNVSGFKNNLKGALA